MHPHLQLSLIYNGLHGGLVSRKYSQAVEEPIIQILLYRCDDTGETKTKNINVRKSERNFLFIVDIFKKQEIFFPALKTVVNTAKVLANFKPL